MVEKKVIGVSSKQNMSDDRAPVLAVMDSPSSPSAGNTQ